MSKKLKPDEIIGVVFLLIVLTTSAFALFLIGLGLYSFINIIF